MRPEHEPLLHALQQQQHLVQQQRLHLCGGGGGNGRRFTPDPAVFPPPPHCDSRHPMRRELLPLPPFIRRHFFFSLTRRSFGPYFPLFFFFLFFSMGKPSFRSVPHKALLPICGGPTFVHVFPHLGALPTVYSRPLFGLFSFFFRRFKAKNCTFGISHNEALFRFLEVPLSCTDSHI